MRKLFRIVLAVVAIVFATFLVAPYAGASAEHTPSACPLQAGDGRVVVEFPDSWRLYSSSHKGAQSHGPLAVSVPAGTYDIKLASWDNHGEKQDQVQLHEQWFAILGGDGFSFQTNVTPDLSENRDLQGWTVDRGVALEGEVTEISVYHAYVVRGEANSVNAVCIAFDLVEPEPVTTTTSTTTTTTTSTTTTSTTMPAATTTTSSTTTTAPTTTTTAPPEEPPEELPNTGFPLQFFAIAGLSSLGVGLLTLRRVRKFGW